jgi:hypothetical protein
VLIPFVLTGRVAARAPPGETQKASGGPLSPIRPKL